MFPSRALSCSTSLLCCSTSFSRAYFSFSTSFFLLPIVFAIIGEENPRAPLYDPASYSEVLVAVYDYDPREPHELKLEEGDRIGALEDYGDGWSYGVILLSDEATEGQADAPISFGPMGLFPTSYAELE